MPVRVTGSWKIEIDLAAAVKPMADAILSRVIERTEVQGLDASGAALPEYSPLYRAQLEAIGQSTTPTMIRSGALMRDLKIISAEVTGDKVRIVIGVGEGSSMDVPRPPPWVFSSKQTAKQRASALERWRASSKTPRPSKPHSELVADLAEPVNGRHARRIMGLSAEDMRLLVAVLERAKIMKS